MDVNTNVGNKNSNVVGSSGISAGLLVYWCPGITCLYWRFGITIPPFLFMQSVKHKHGIPAFPMHHFISWSAEMLALFPNLFGSIVDLNLFDQQIFKNKKPGAVKPHRPSRFARMLSFLHVTTFEAGFHFLSWFLLILRMLIPPCHLDSNCCLAASQASTRPRTSVLTAVWWRVQEGLHLPLCQAVRVGGYLVGLLSPPLCQSSAPTHQPQWREVGGLGEMTSL